MTIELYTILRNELEPKLDAASKLVSSLPKNEMGLMIKTPESILAKNNYDFLFAKFRNLNKSVSNKIKRQYHINKNGGSIYSLKN